MDKQMETIQACARKPQLTQLDMVDLITACNACARHYTSLIEEQGRNAEGARITFLRDEARRAHEVALVQKEPRIPEELVKKLETAIDGLAAVATKEPTTKKLQFPAQREDSAGPTGAADDNGQEQAHNDDDEGNDGQAGGEDGGAEEEEEEMDSEMEFLAAVERERKEFMGGAALHSRLLLLLTSVALILGCVGVVFVSEGQYNKTLELDERNQLKTLLRIGIDALNVLPATSNLTLMQIRCQQVLDDLSHLQLASWASPVQFMDDRGALVEYSSVTYTEDNGIRVFDRSQVRKFSLLCQPDLNLPVEMPNDLGYSVNRTVSVLQSENCPSQTTGDSIWKQLGSDVISYDPNGKSYINKLSRQAAILHNTCQLGVMAQATRDSLRDMTSDNILRAGVINPLKHAWQRSTALWAAFAIGVGILFFVISAEMCQALARDERLSDWAAMGLHAAIVAITSLVVVIVVASISWTFLRDELNAKRLIMLEGVGRATMAALTSPAVQTVSSTLTLQTLVQSSSLSGQLVVTSSADGSTVPTDSTSAFVSSAAGAFSLAQKAGLLRAESGSVRLSTMGSYDYLLYASYYVPSLSKVFTLYRHVDTGIILDAGKRAAGPALGVLGFQLVAVLLYCAISPLRSYWAYASGAIWQEQWVKPIHFRLVVYMVVFVVVFATSLATAFYATSLVASQNEAAGQRSNLILSQALAASVAGGFISDYATLNSGLPSFVDALIFQLGSPSWRSTSTPQLVPGQTPRFPIPAQWVDWESNFFGAALSLDNVTTTTVAPAYFTPMAATNYSRLQPQDVIYMQTVSAPISSTKGLAVQRMLSSVAITPAQSYAVYVSFVVAAVLSVAIACALYEFLYRSASTLRENDEYDYIVERYSWMMFAVMILPAFAVLIGAGGAIGLLKGSLDTYLFDDAAWVLDAVRPLVENYVQSHITLNNAATAATVVSSTATFITSLNARLGSIPVTARWVLLQENATLLDGTHVTAAAGANIAASFALNDPSVVSLSGSSVSSISTGTWPSGLLFNTASTTTPFLFALTAVTSGLMAIEAPQPNFYLGLTVDYEESTRGRHSGVIVPLLKVAGATVPVLFLIFALAHWYSFRLSDAADFPVIDQEHLYPALAHTEANEFIAPPVLPRSTRLFHMFGCLMFVLTLVYFTASMTFTAQKLRAAVSQPRSISLMYNALLSSIITDVVSPFWEYAVTSLTSTKSQFSSGSVAFSATGGTGALFHNASSAIAIASSFSTMANLAAAALNTAPRFNTEDLVVSFQETYHAATMQAVDTTGDEFSQIRYPLEAALGSLQLLASRIANNVTTVPTGFAGDQLALALYYIAEVLDTATKAEILERVAVNSLLDFSSSATSTNARSFALAGSQTAVITRIKAVYTRLTAKLASAVTNATTAATLAVGGDTTLVADVLAALGATSARLQSLNALSDSTTDGVWGWQQKQVSELFYAVYGDNGTLNGAIATLAAGMTTQRNAIVDAMQWEDVTRRYEDYLAGRQASRYRGDQFVTWPSLTPWTTLERLWAVRDATGTAVAAIATSIVLMVVCWVLWTAVSMRSFRFASQAAHELTLVHGRIPNPILSRSGSHTGDGEDDDNDSTMSLLEKNAERHVMAHHRRLIVVAAWVLVCCVPVGFAFWVTREGYLSAPKQIVDADVAIALARLSNDLQWLGTEGVYLSSVAYITGDWTSVNQFMGKFASAIREAQSLAVSREQSAFRQLQALESAGVTSFASVAPDQAAELYRVTLLRNKLRNISTMLGQLMSNWTAEVAVYQAVIAASSNISTALLPLQNIAAATCGQLLATTDATAWESILAPVGPFAAGSLVQQYTADQVQTFVVSGQSLGSNATAIRQFAASLATTLPSVLLNALSPSRWELDVWSLLTTGTRKNSSATVSFHGSGFLTVPSVASQFANATVASEITVRFTAIRNLAVATSDGTLQPLFSNTAISTPLAALAAVSGNYSLLTLDSKVLFAAAISTYFRQTPLISTLRQRFAFNRNLYTATQLQQNKEYSVSFFELITGIQQSVNDLRGQGDVSLALPTLVAAETQTSTSIDRVSGTLVTVAQGLYDKHNMEFVSVAVEWCCTVAFWSVFAAFYFIVVDFKLMYL